MTAGFVRNSPSNIPQQENKCRDLHPANIQYEDLCVQLTTPYTFDSEKFQDVELPAIYADCSKVVWRCLRQDF